MNQIILLFFSPQKIQWVSKWLVIITIIDCCQLHNNNANSTIMWIQFMFQISAEWGMKQQNTGPGSITTVFSIKMLNGYFLTNALSKVTDANCILKETVGLYAETSINLLKKRSRTLKTHEFKQGSGAAMAAKSCNKPDCAKWSLQVQLALG